MRHLKLNLRTALMASTALVMVGLPMQAKDVDDKIESSAKNSYNFKTFLKHDDIKVESKHGNVTLSGTVAMDYHRSLAEDTVSGLPGVKSVINNLRVVGDQPKDQSDGWISTKVKSVLAYHRNVSASDTEVSTQNGIVTLSGRANTEAQKQLTGEYAKDVEGVMEVRNNINVKKGSQRTLGDKVDDSSITAQVKSSLLFHKSTHALTTKVSTKNGVVTLHGEAKNEAERALVTRLTNDINGVKQVDNRMTLRY